MIETQSSICTWADDTFGAPASDASIAARALVDMAALVTACVNGEPAERIGMEIADVVIVLARLGRSLGVQAVPLVDWVDSFPHCMLRYATGASSALSDLLMARGDRASAASCLRLVVAELRNLAVCLNVSLCSTIDAKMAINRARKWVLDGNGHGRHVEEDK